MLSATAALSATVLSTAALSQQAAAASQQAVLSAQQAFSVLALLLEQATNKAATAATAKRFFIIVYLFNVYESVLGFQKHDKVSSYSHLVSNKSHFFWLKIFNVSIIINHDLLI